MKDLHFEGLDLYKDDKLQGDRVSLDSFDYIDTFSD